MGGNVTVKTIATFGTLSQKEWVGGSHLCLLQALASYPSDSGSSGVFSIYSV